MSNTIIPFDEQPDQMSLGYFNIENCTDRVAIYGALNVTRDKLGLDNARTLKKVLDKIVATLEAEDLPDKIEFKPFPPAKHPCKN